MKIQNRKALEFLILESNHDQKICFYHDGRWIAIGISETCSTTAILQDYVSDIAATNPGEAIADAVSRNLNDIETMI